MGKKVRNSETQDQSQQPKDVNQAGQSNTFKMSRRKLRNIAKRGSKQSNQRSKGKMSKFKFRYFSGEMEGFFPQSRFQCAICLQLMVGPTLLECGHLFCLRCLETNATYSSRCCLCRTKEYSDILRVSLQVQEIINRFVLPQYSEILKYFGRTTDFQLWKNNRKLVQFQEGCFVDFRDSDNVWRKALICQISKEDRMSNLHIKWKLNGESMRDLIQSTSHRLAPYTFFTKFKYLKDIEVKFPESQIPDLVTDPIEDSDPLIFQNQENMDQGIVEVEQTQNNDDQRDFEGSLFDQLIGAQQTIL